MHTARATDDAHAEGMLMRKPRNKFNAARDHFLHQHARKPRRRSMPACSRHDLPEASFDGSGIEEAEATGAKVFHAGTVRKDGKLLTAGGRVLGVTAQGKDLREAQANAYVAVRKISFKAAHYRTDIGSKALGSSAGA